MFDRVVESDVRVRQVLVDPLSRILTFSDMTVLPFESGGGEPDFALTLNPRSCFVTGYVLKAS